MGIIVVLIIIGIIITLFIQAMCDAKNENKAEEILNDRKFKTSRKFSCNVYSGQIELRTDLENKQIAICEIKQEPKIDIIKFENIIDCEIIEDASTIMKGGVGRAIVGGTLAGGIGAIVGASTRKSNNVTNSLQIRIITNDLYNSLCMLKLISSETKKDSLEYQNAMEFANNVYATLNSIISNNQKEKAGYNTDDAKNLVKQLSDLKKDGIITEEQFEKSKEKVFNNNPNDESKREDTNSLVNLTIIQADQKIQLITMIKKELGIGLKEAKYIADQMPVTILSNISKTEAEKWKNKLEEIGAVVEIENT